MAIALGKRLGARPRGSEITVPISLFARADEVIE
jgi:hypothetical protein